MTTRSLRLLLLPVFLLLPLGVTGAASAAARVKATVVRVDTKNHRLHTVRNRQAYSWRYSGRLPRGVRLGTRVSFRPGAKRISALRRTGRSRRVAFYAQVAGRGGNRLKLRLTDGSSLRLPTSVTRGRASASELQAGDSISIALLLDANGNVIGIEVRIVAAGLADPSTTVGQVVDITDDLSHFTVLDDVGRARLFAAADGQLRSAQVQLCDTVSVRFHLDGRVRVVDDLQLLDPSDDQSCVNTSDDPLGDVLVAGGTVSSVSSESLVVTPIDGSEALTLVVEDPALIEGLQPGDPVVVAYTQGDDGSLVLEDVYLVEMPDLGDPGTDPLPGDPPPTDPPPPTPDPQPAPLG